MYAIRSYYGLSPLAPDQKRHVFARMVGTVDLRIAAVIRGNDQQIVFAQRLLQLRQPGIKISYNFV